MLVRTAVIDDVPRMMDLEREAETAAHWSEQDYQAIFLSPTPPRIALVVETDGALRGFIVARCFEREWEIENVIVARASRRQGVGSELVRAMLRRAREEGAQSLDLEVRSTNIGAIELYRKWGFSHIGLRKSYYSNPLDDAVLLRAEIAAATTENG